LNAHAGLATTTLLFNLGLGLIGFGLVFQGISAKLRRKE
jgi:hypothetical protein